MSKPIVFPSPNKKYKATLAYIGEIQADQVYYSEAHGPKTCLLLIIDLVARRECVIANVEGVKGNILPESFVGESLMYSVVYYGQFGMTKSFESKFQYLDGWQTLK